MGEGEPGKNLRLLLAVRNRDRSLQANRPGDQSAEVLDRLRDLVKIPVKAHDDGNIANPGEKELDNVQPYDEIYPLFLGTHPRAEQHLLRWHALTGCGQSLARMPPVPVIPERTGHHGDALTAHDGEPPVKIASAFRVGVRVWPSRVEAAFNVRPPARKVLCEKVRMAKGMTEQRSAGLVEILAIDKDQDLGSRVCRERRDRWIRHLVIKAERTDKKAPVIPKGSRGR
jgi:hypothetical protein